MLSTISKKSKTNYYNHYFKNNWNSIKNIWKGLKSILNIKSIFAISVRVFLSMVHYFQSNGNLKYFQQIFFFNCYSNEA